jgi:hypothetical protein
LNGTIGTATGTADLYSNFTAFGPYTIDATKVQKLVVNSNNTIYTKQNGAWIDWNQDGDFADAGECIFVTTAGTGAVSSLAGPYAFGIQSGANWVFSVPAGAKNGNTRMRLVVSETSGLTATPPTSVSWGEWEDYTVNVINAPVVEPCPGATLPLTSNVANGGEPYTYTWSLISGGGTGTLSSTSAANPTITPTLDFVVRVDITDNCGSTTFSEVPIGVFDSPIVITPASVSVCGNPGTTFTASGGSNTNYTWTPTDGAGALNTTTGDTVVATPTATVTYTATGSYGAGCTGTAQATLNYITPPAITITNAEQPNNIYCGVASNTSTITASSAGTYTYTWTNGTGNSAADNLVQVSNGIVSATADNSYTLTLGAVEVGGLGCALNQPFTVATFPLPSTNMSATPSVIGLGSTSSLASGVAAGNFSVTNCLTISHAPAAIPQEGAGLGQSTYLAKAGAATVPLTSGGNDDGGWGGIPLGFTYNFFGQDYTSINVGTNGAVTFGTYNAAAVSDFTFAGFPNTTDPTACIAVCGADLNFGGDANADIAYWVTGAAPSRTFYLTYNGVNGFGGNGEFTVQLQLQETTGRFQIHHTSTAGNTAAKTIGANGPATAFTGSISGTTLDVTVAPDNTLRVGQAVGTTFTNYGIITAVLSGNGGVGQYTLSQSNNIASTTLNTVIGATAPNCQAVAGSCDDSATSGPNKCTWKGLTASNHPSAAWQFNPPVDYTYEWQPAAQIQGLNDRNTATALPTAAGVQQYTLSITDNVSGCSNAGNLATVSVNVIGAPAAPTVLGYGLLSNQQSSSGTVNYCGPQGLALQVNGDSLAYPASQNGQALTYAMRVYDVPTGGSNLVYNSGALGIAYSLPDAFPPVAGVTGSYCTPANSPSTNGYGIESVSTSGPGFNFSNSNTGVTVGGYSNYTATMGCIAGVGSSVSMNILGASGETYGFAVWVDYNQNGTFETTERVLATSGYVNSYSGTFTVPGSAATGLTRMRVLSHYLNSSPTNPCEASSLYIEVEDYAFNVGALPAATLSANTTRYVSVYNGFAESPRTQVDYIYTTPPALTVTGISADGSSSATPVVCGPALNVLNNGYSSVLSASGPVGQTPPYTFAWGVNPGQPGVLSANSGASVTASMSNTLSVNYQADDGAGCIVIGSIAITRNDFPAITLSSTPAVICPGETSTLSSTTPATGYTYSWSSVGVDGSITGSTTGATADAVTNASNQYQLISTRTSDGCDNSDNQQAYLTITPNTSVPTVSFVSDDQTVATGGLFQTVQFTVDPVISPAFSGVNASTYAWTIIGPSPSSATSNISYVGGTSATSRDPQVQFLLPGSYTVVLDMTNCNGTGTLSRPDYIVASPTFCQPNFTSAAAGCASGQGLGLVTIADNLSNPVMTHNSACNGTNGGYENFGPPVNNSPIGGTTTCTFFQGNTYTITVVSNGASNGFFGVWIDINNDSDFLDAGEFLSGANSTASNTATFTYSVPSVGAIYGLHRMRVIGGFATGALTQASSCGPVVSNFGETQDYSVNFQPTALPNDVPGAATNTPYQGLLSYPNSLVRTATLAQATNSPQSVQITGPDIWVKFTAVTPAVSITMNSSSMDDIIALYSFDGTNYNLFGGTTTGLENVGVGTGDFERLNANGLTIGQEYYIVFGTNDAIGGPFTWTLQHLFPSGCGTAAPPAGFTLCSTYKALYRGASPTVTYAFTFSPQAGSLGGGTVSGTSGSTALSSPSYALRYANTYSARVDVTYNLTNSIGGPDVITIQGPTTGICANVPISAQPNVEVRSTQRCPVVLQRYTYLGATAVAGSPIMCGATGYTWELTAAAGCPGVATGIPVEFNTPSVYLNLNSLPNLGVNNGNWIVRVRPNFAYGNGTYGPAQTIVVANTAAGGMLSEEAEAESLRQLDEANANIYPNPNNGEMVNLNLNGLEGNVMVRIMDAVGRVVYTQNFIVEGTLNTIASFAEPLSSGLYSIEFSTNGTVVTEKMVVTKE